MEKALEDKKAMIVPYGDWQSEEEKGLDYQVVVLDGKLLKKYVWEYEANYDKSKRTDVPITFEDIHGKRFRFSDSKDKQPTKRFLSHHAAVSFVGFLNKGWGERDLRKVDQPPSFGTPMKENTVPPLGVAMSEVGLVDMLSPSLRQQYKKPVHIDRSLTPTKLIY